MRQKSENRLDYALERMVAGTLHTGDPQLARAAIDDWLASGEADAMAWEALTAESIGYLDAMRDAGLSGEQLDTAVRWVLNHLGLTSSAPQRVSHDLAEDPKISSHRSIGEVWSCYSRRSSVTTSYHRFTWLLAGLVETSGASDLGWLKQFRPVR